MITETSFEESIVITICRFFGELEIVHLCPGSMLRQSTQDQMKHEVTTYKKSTKIYKMSTALLHYINGGECFIE